MAGFLKSQAYFLPCGLLKLPQPMVWKMGDLETVRKEVAEKRQKFAEAVAQKQQKKITLLSTDLLKAQQSSVAVADIFKTGGQAYESGNY